MSVKVDYIFKTLGILVYVGSMVGGLYFIYQGGIVQRFNLKRTNFAIYSEPIVELPTIVAYVYPWTNEIFYGTNFNISYEKRNPSTSDTVSGTKLVYGENSIQDTNLKVEFQKFQSNNFKIRPLNYKTGMDHDYVLTFKFSDSSIMANRSVGIHSSTENNTTPCGETDYYDGIAEDIALKLGSYHEMYHYPEKYIYLEDDGKCRHQPYVEEVNKYVEKHLFAHCTKPCRPNLAQQFSTCWGLGLSDIIMSLPICNNDKELGCALDIIDEAKNAIMEKPCTKLQYKIFSSSWEGSENAIRVSLFIAKPQKVTVHEEYLIYDLITVIGAIGGTFSLWTGISFKEIMISMLCNLKQMLEWSKHDRKKIKVNPEKRKRQYSKGVPICPKK